VSPCYSDSYTSCGLRYQHCYVSFPDLTEGQWLGFYNGDRDSSIYAGDRLVISNVSTDGEHAIAKEVTFTSLKDNQFIQNYGYSGIGPALSFLNSLIYTSQAEYKFRLLFKCKRSYKCTLSWIANNFQRTIPTSCSKKYPNIIIPLSFNF